MQLTGEAGAARLESAGCSEIIEVIGVAYVLDGVTSSGIEAVDMAGHGVGGSKDSIENGR
jgi:hypothetical protein